MSFRLHRVDLETLDQRYRANLVNSLTGFKSLNLLGSFSMEGGTNVAPFTQVIHIGANPPLIGVLFRPHTVVRHTLENILETEFFTLNHVSQALMADAHWAAARWEDSEFDTTGLEKEYKADWPAPFVKGAPVQMACQLAERVDIAANGTHLVVASIEQVHLAEGEWVEADGFLDLEAAGSLTVSGLDSYHSTKRLARYAYAKPDQPPRTLD